MAKGNTTIRVYYYYYYGMYTGFHESYHLTFSGVRSGELDKKWTNVLDTASKVAREHFSAEKKKKIKEIKSQIAGNKDILPFRRIELRKKLNQVQEAIYGGLPLYEERLLGAKFISGLGAREFFVGKNITLYEI